MVVVLASYPWKIPVGHDEQPIRFVLSLLVARVYRYLKVAGRDGL